MKFRRIGRSWWSGQYKTRDGRVIWRAGNSLSAVIRAIWREAGL